MSHRIVLASAFAIASLCATSAFAGSPYYDADGQVIASPATQHGQGLGTTATGHAAGTEETVAASDAPVPEVRSTNGVAMPKMDADGFQHPEADTNLYEHAVGSDGAP